MSPFIISIDFIYFFWYNNTMRTIIKKTKILFIPCEENNYKPRFLESNVLFYWILVLLVLKLVTVSSIFCFPKTFFFADLTKVALIDLTNQERKSMGLSVLVENPVLDQAAYQKAQDMLALDYFSHQSPTGTTPWYWFKKAGYNYRVAGENLAIGFLDSEEVVKSWINSPTHKANLLSPKFQDIGLAVVKGDFQGAETTVVVQMFGTPFQQTQTVLKTTETKKENSKAPPETQEIITTTQKPEVKEILPAQITEEPKITEEPTVKEETGTSEFQPSALQKPSLTEAVEDKGKSSLNFLKFMSLSYPNILQKIIFYSLLLITLALVLNIFIKIHIQDKKLIFKTVAFIILLGLFIWSDKEVVIQLIPHNLLI